MIARSNVFIELSSKNIAFVSYVNNKIKSKNFAEKTFDTSHELQNYLETEKYSGYYIILIEEEVLIKTILFPNTGKSKLKNLVRNELVYLYRNIDEILYTYVKIGERKNTQEILVYCLNSKNFTLLQKNHEVFLKAKRIASVQFVFYRYFSKRIKDQNYILVFSYRSSLYFIACINGNLSVNYVIKDFSLTDFKKYLKNFTEKYDIFGTSAQKINKVYSVNLFQGRDKHLFEQISEFYYQDLGTVKCCDIFCEILGEEINYNCK